MTRAVHTPATIGGMPNKPKTPLRAIRISDELWQAAQAKAAEEQESVSDVVRRSLESYVKLPKKPATK